MKCLLLGCGTNRDRRIPIDSEAWPGELVTLDADPSVRPAVVHDLECLPYPFADGEFDEIHAYEVLEHVGRQGDWRFFFAQFTELYRILKPGGYVALTVPHWESVWAWGDPGHTRILPLAVFYWLDQRHYEQVGRTACTDYRPWWKGDLKIVGHDTHGPDTLAVVLHKPER